MTHPLRKPGLAAAIAFGIATFLLTACAQQEVPVPAAISPGVASKLLVRGQLQGLQAIDLRSQRRNNVLVVQAEIANTQRHDLRLFYRFRWTDRSGMQVGDGEVWKPLVFLGLQTQILKGTAYGPQATDFQIEMSAEPR